MRVVTRILRWAAAGLAAIVILVLIGLVVVQTTWFKERLRVLAVTRTAAMLNGELRITRLGGGLWTGVTLDGVEIVQAGQPVIAADQIRIHYDPWNFVHRHWVFDDIVLERARIRAAETPDGWNVLHLIKTRSGSAGATFSIGRLRLESGTVAVEPAQGAARSFTNVDLDSKLTVDKGRMEFRVATLRAHDETSGLDVRELSGNASDGFREFDLHLVAASPTSEIAGRVRGTTIDDGRAIDGDLNLTHVNVSQFLPDRDQRWATDISGHLVVRGILPPGAPGRATYQFSGTRLAALGYNAEVVDATGQIDRDHVTFDAHTTAYGGRATASGAFRFATAAKGYTFASRGTYTQMDLRRLPKVWLLPPLDTRLAGDYELDVSGGNWRARTTMAASVVEGAAIAAGTTAWLTSSRGLTRYTAEGVVSRLDLQRLARPLEVRTLAEPRFASSLNGRFFVTGQERGGAQARLLVGGASLEASEISGTRLPAMHALVHWTGRRIAVEADGLFEQLTEKTAAPLVDVPMVLDGQIDARFVVRDIDAPWTADNVEGDGRIVLGPSTLQALTIDQATIDGRFVDSALDLGLLDVRGPTGSVKAYGSVGLGATGSANLQVSANITDLAALGAFVHAPLSGAAVIEATVTGPAGAPTAQGKATLRQAAYGGAASALVSTIDFKGKVADPFSFEATADASFVEVKGNKIQQLTAKVAGNLEQLSIDVQADQQDRSLGVQGLVVVNEDSQELRLQRLVMTTQGLTWALPEGRVASVCYGRGRVEISDLSLVRGEQRIDVEGGIEIGTSEPASSPAASAVGVTVKVQNVDVADVNHLLLGTRDLAGRLDGTITIQGARQAPVIDADMALRAGAVEGIAFSSAVARVQYRDREATIDATLEQSAGVQLRATGTVPMGSSGSTGNGDKGMDIRVSGGPVRLGLAQAFTTEITKVEGTTTLDLHVTGTVAAPDVRGTAAINGGAFTVAATGGQYHGLEAAIEFAGSHLVVKQLQLIDSDNDLLTAQGGLDLSGDPASRQLDVQVRARKFAILRNHFGLAEVDGDLQVSGTFGAPEVKGTLELNTGRLEVGDILERTMKTPYSTEAQAPLAPASSAAPAPSQMTLFDRAKIDLRLTVPDNLLLRGHDLRVSDTSFGIGDMNILVGGNFDVTKAAGGAVALQGAAEVVRGSYTFQGQRFDVARGSDVRFRGGPITDPAINLTATREVSGVTTQVRLQGTTREPEVRLSSQPPLDEGDVLSLIVFNQPMNSLGASERINLAERAATMAAGAIATPLADSIARVLNLDLVEIQAPASKDAPGAVSFGSRIGPRVFVGLRQQFGREEASVFSLEYRVTELLRFVTSVAQGALQAHATRRVDQSGVDLIFLIRY